MPKISVGTNHRFVIGAGPSAALDPWHGYLHPSLWINAELGYAYHRKGGMSLLVVGGIAGGITGRMHDLCFMGCTLTWQG